MSEVPAESPGPERLSDALRRLLAGAEGCGMVVRDMVEVLQGRGIQMVVILLCLPFLTPVAIPGISVPFGLAIALSGIRIACGHKPWLPRFILDRTVSYAIIERMVRFGCAIYVRLERVIRPRLVFLLEGKGMNIALGLAIAVSGLLLSLPIPPPFPLTNTIPGFAIILISLGIIERDGVLVICGYVLTAIATLYVIAIARVGTEGVGYLWKFLTGE